MKKSSLFVLSAPHMSLLWHLLCLLSPLDASLWFFISVEWFDKLWPKFSGREFLLKILDMLQFVLFLGFGSCKGDGCWPSGLCPLESSWFISCVVPCDTKLFSFFIQTWKLLWLDNISACMCVCVFACAYTCTREVQCTERLSWAGCKCNYKFGNVMFILLSLSLIFLLLCLHVTLLPLLFSPFYFSHLFSPMLSSFNPSHPFPFLCHHWGNKGICWILMMIFVEDSLGTVYCMWTEKICLKIFL